MDSDSDNFVSDIESVSDNAESISDNAQSISDNTESDSDNAESHSAIDSGDDMDNENEEYTTTSEHTTTDTSINSDSSDHDLILEYLHLPGEMSELDSNEADVSSNITLDVSHVTVDDSVVTVSSEDLDNEWDVTTSLDVPQSLVSESLSPLREVLQALGSIWSPRNVISRSNNGDHVSNIREERFRARSWSLEECSICCDIMLKDQAITSLPCTHQFHEACIQPWLSMNEQQTCPNCRKTAA